MLRIAMNKNRPLLHMMRAWSVVAPHLVEAACHKERHVSQKAVSFIHDVLTEVLTSWAELPHFHFNEALLEDVSVSLQVITSIGELVEMCSPQILSGWRPLFSALRTVHSSKTDTKDYLLGEYSMGKSQAPVFDVFEAFINTDNIQVFANAATDYIMCLLKFVKGLDSNSLCVGEVDYKEIGDCVHASGYSSTDLCLPALDYLRKCSQLLAKIYKMQSKPVFLGARLASLPMRSQERSVSNEDGMDCVLQEFDDDTGPGFAIFAVIQLLLPVMSLWLQRSHGDHSYWDVAAANFKHAIGLCCELVVEHNLLACFHSGSDSFSGDACEVFMLDTQCSPKTPNNKEGFEHAQSCVLIIELPTDQQSNGHTQKRIPFRTIVVSLLSHQVLLQNLYDILLEEFVKHPDGTESVTPVTSDPSRATAGFLRYISMTNLAIILDLLLDSYRTARDFDTRPGLKYLLMKVSGVCGAANLYRQSAMSFNLYFQALLCATLSQADSMTAQQRTKTSLKKQRSVQPLSSADWAWLVKRLYKLCLDLCNSYIQMHRDLESTLEDMALLRGGAGGGGDHVFFLPLYQSETSTPTSAGGLSAQGTPSEDGGYRCQAADRAASPADTPTPSPGFRSGGERRDSGLTGSSAGAAPVSAGPGRRKEWWESAGNKLYTIATDKTISKLMMEYKRRKQQQQQPQQQSHVNLFMKEQGRAAGAAGGVGGGGGERRAPMEPQRAPQRPQHLVDQQGPALRHSVSAGPEVLRQDKRPRSGSTISSHSISLRDSEAQIQPALYPCLSQLSCHVTDARVRQALREWLGRVGRLYDIVV
ncbi:hypothetical protein FQN60_014676 [Etheostoma spectabile]|uniref:Sec7/BIG1-like C-terminal domain-containing protein n=1 Tax=Etheostoma spectabile TaxID=54343 RepID=A0A5J5CN23_9PERO|nr:hypothetical protein FQN60_014676 [Etheostoma spectabile]